jgi:hypothetical protein
VSDRGHGTTPGGSLWTSLPIAALYVTKGGVYFGLEGVDPWDEERDAIHASAASPPETTT